MLSTVFTHSYHTHLHCQLRSKCSGRARDKGLVQLWSSAHKPLLFSSFHPPLDSAILQKCSVSLSQRQTPGAAAAAARSVPDLDTVTTPPLPSTSKKAVIQVFFLKKKSLGFSPGEASTCSSSVLYAFWTSFFFFFLKFLLVWLRVAFSRVS